MTFIVHNTFKEEFKWHFSIRISAENGVGENVTKSQMLVAWKPMKGNLMQNLTFFMRCLA